MRRTVLLLATAVLAVPAAAAAKGPSHATVTGPGLDDQLVLQAEDAMRVMEHSGFWETASTYARTPPLGARPRGDLGPKYVIEWRLPRIIDAFLVRQDVYPYAPGGPVTHVRAGQMLFDRPTTGGWYRTSDVFKRTLVSLGLPQREPSSDGRPWAIVPVAVFLLGVSLVTRRTMRRGGERRAD